MNSRDITVYLDERWCNALESATGTKVEALLQERMDALVQQLPPEVRLPIEADIRREEQLRANELDAKRRLAVFRVTKDGRSHCYRSDHRDDFLELGIRLRQYLRSDAPDVSQLISKAASVPLEQFEQYTAEMVSGSPRVTGAFDIDLDSGLVSTLSPKDGWHCYRVKDVSTAVYFATKSQSQWWKRDEVFHDRLEGKELTDTCRPVFIRGEHQLPADALAFQDEVSEIGHLLNFYIPVRFDPDGVFGTHVAVAENDDYLNVYSNYDLKRGRPLDTLQVCLVRGDGSELDCQYRLSPEEQESLRSKMDSYCIERTGRTLEETRAQYLLEESGDTPREEAQQIPSQQSGLMMQM